MAASRWLSLLVLDLMACGGGGEEVARIARQWTHEGPATTAPPGVGPERRVLVLLKDAAPEGGGQLVTLDDGTGRPIEGPFPAPLTDHAPVFSSGKIVVLTKIGKIVAMNLAGETLYTVPDGNGLGLSSPLAVAPDGSLRVGTTSGLLLGFAIEDGRELFRVDTQGAIASPLAVAPDGTTYAATDLGRLVGVDARGVVVFDRTVTPPASGPSVAASGEILVGEGSGVRIFGADGGERAAHARAARVVGTRLLDEGRFLAWGEDGVVEILRLDGGVETRFTTASASPPPVYAPPLPLPGGAFGVLDHLGKLHLVGADGVERTTFALAAEPLREVAQASTASVLLVAVGRTIEAVRFTMTVE
ncbi:MAG: PQQ-like beta-propeller repeat protein [Deltaproteobacteria bacterium]|nr:PQQ-like beta-propeller repeat protein [Deltaproteobacteria bacterium]